VPDIALPKPLDHLLTQFSLRAGVFYTGNICGLHDFEGDQRRGHLHLVKTGPVQLTEPGRATIVVDRPTLVFLPRPETHRLVSNEREGADVVCATVLLGGGGRNPISDSLPDAVLVELDQMAGIHEILALMFDEAFSDRSGRQALLDRLCEVVMIKMLRHCLDHGIVAGGALAGLADAKLAKTLEAIHRQPASGLSGLLAHHAGPAPVGARRSCEDGGAGCRLWQLKRAASRLRP